MIVSFLFLFLFLYCLFSDVLDVEMLFYDVLLIAGTSLEPTRTHVGFAHPGIPPPGVCTQSLTVTSQHWQTGRARF